MSPILIVRLALSLAAMALFGLGIRMNSEPLRWTAIGLLAAAVLMRFVKRPRP